VTAKLRAPQTKEANCTKYFSQQRVKLLKTLAPNRKTKTPPSTGTIKHFCSKIPADISLSVAGRMATFTDGRNNVRTLTYTDKSQLVNETFGSGTAVSQTSTYTRDAQGLIASVTDHRSRRKATPGSQSNAQRRGHNAGVRPCFLPKPNISQNN
jgi:YD repeat-containing protein